METDHPYKHQQRELRYRIEAGANVEVIKNGRTIRATTVNMSGCGVLLHFERPVQLVVGDQVMVEFKITDQADKPLPYWAVGNIVRVEGCRVAIEFKGGVFSRLDPGTGIAVPPDIESDAR
jgi:hypothetical protein